MNLWAVIFVSRKDVKEKTGSEIKIYVEFLNLPERRKILRRLFRLSEFCCYIMRTSGKQYMKIKYLLSIAEFAYTLTDYLLI